MTYSKFIPLDLSTVTERQLAPMQRALDPGSPQLWQDIAELLFLSLRAADALKTIPDEAIADAAATLVYQTAFSYGGCNFYLPKGCRFSVEIKANNIAKEFKGNNIFELATKYRVTDNRVRQILFEKGVLKRIKRPCSQ